MHAAEDFVINLHPSGAVLIRPDTQGAVTCVVRGVVAGDGVVVSMITRPGEVSIRFEQQGMPSWYQTFSIGEPVAQGKPRPADAPAPPAPRRARGRPRKYPLPPAPLTMGDLVGENEATG